jgi:hypothetical protein
MFRRRRAEALASPRNHLEWDAYRVDCLALVEEKQFEGRWAAGRQSGSSSSLTMQEAAERQRDGLSGERVQL